jgi:hypothetical protein
MAKRFTDQEFAIVFEPRNKGVKRMDSYDRKETEQRRRREMATRRNKRSSTHHFVG